MSSSDAMFEASCVYFQYVNERIAHIIFVPRSEGPLLSFISICSINDNKINDIFISSPLRVEVRYNRVDSSCPLKRVGADATAKTKHRLMSACLTSCFNTYCHF